MMPQEWTSVERQRIRGHGEETAGESGGVPIGTPAFVERGEERADAGAHGFWDASGAFRYFPVAPPANEPCDKQEAFLHKNFI